MDTLEETKKILSKVLVLPPEKFTAEQQLLEIEGMDSLAFETIVVEIEDRTGRDVDTAKLLDLKTVQDLANLIQGLRAG